MPYKLRNVFKTAVVLLLLWNVFLGWEGSSALAAGKLFSLKGQVLDKNSNKPLPGADVYIPGLKVGASSDTDGYFLFKIARQGRFKVICELVGYKTLTTYVMIAANQKLITLYMEEGAIEIEGIDVTGRRSIIPHATAVLSESELEKSQGQTLGETLKKISGVTVMQTGPSIAKPVIRGLHSNRIVVLNAGVAQEGQQWGEEHAPAIDPFAMTKIEVIKGAAGVQYGSNAMGGVIRVEPRKLSEIKKFKGKLNINTFYNNQQGAGSLVLEGPSGLIEGINWRLQGSMRKAGDAKTPIYYLDNTGFQETNFSVALGYSRSKGEIEAYYSCFGTELGIFKGSHYENPDSLKAAIQKGHPVLSDRKPFSYTIEGPRQTVLHNLLSLRGKYNFNSVGWIEMKYGGQYNRRKEFDAHSSLGQSTALPAFDMELISHSAEASFHHNPVLNIYGKIGTNGMVQKNATKAIGRLIPNFLAYNAGAYWIENWNMSKLTVDVGSRFDYRWMEVLDKIGDESYQKILEYQNVSGVFGASYKLNDDWSLGSDIGTSWRPPAVNELYSKGVHHGSGRIERGTLRRSLASDDKRPFELDGEKGINIDLTLRKTGEKSQLQFSVFNNRIKNFVFLTPYKKNGILVIEKTIRGAFPVFLFDQTDARLRGIEGDFDLWLSSYYRMDFSASMVRGDNLKTDEPLIFMPADRFKLTQHLRFPSIEIFHEPYIEFLVTSIQEQKRFPKDIDYIPPPAAYMLFDISLGSGINIANTQLNFILEVQNLLDKDYRDYLSRYRYFASDPGRNISLKLQIPFGKSVK